MRLASQMAIASDKVRAACVEAQEYPELAQRYQVMGVPRTIANAGHALEGAVPEAAFLAFVLRAGGAADGNGDATS